MHLTGEEAETIINFNESEGMASVYTASRRVRSHMLKAGFSPVKSTSHAWWFEVPKQAVRVKMPSIPSIYIGGKKVPESLREITK